MSVLLISPVEAHKEYERLLATFCGHAGWDERGNALRTRYDVTMRRIYQRLFLVSPGAAPLGVIEKEVMKGLESEPLKAAAGTARDCFNKLQHQYSRDTDWGALVRPFTEDAYCAALRATAELIFVFSGEPVPPVLMLASKRFNPATMSEWVNITILADLSTGFADLAEGGRLASAISRLIDATRESGLDKVNFHLYLRQPSEIVAVNCNTSTDASKKAETNADSGYSALEEILDSNREAETESPSPFVPWLIWLRRNASPLPERLAGTLKAEIEARRLRTIRRALTTEAKAAFESENAVPGHPKVEILKPENYALSMKRILDTLRFELRKAGFAKFEETE